MPMPEGSSVPRSCWRTPLFMSIRATAPGAGDAWVQDRRVSVQSASKCGRPFPLSPACSCSAPVSQTTTPSVRPVIRFLILIATSPFLDCRATCWLRPSIVLARLWRRLLLPLTLSCNSRATAVCLQMTSSASLSWMVTVPSLQHSTATTGTLARTHAYSITQSLS